MSTKKQRLKRQPVIEFVEEVDEESEERQRIEKIKKPVVWIQNKGYIIRDIKETQFDEVVHLLKEEFMHTDVLCRNIFISYEPESVNEYMYLVDSILRDKCSICAMHEETNELVGVALLRIIYKEDFGKIASRVRILDGKRYQKIKKILDHMNRKTDIFTDFDCDKYVRMYLVCIDSKHQNPGLYLDFLKAAMDVTRSLLVPVCMGIFPTVRLQNSAKKVGMDIVYEVYYVDWVEKQEIVFSDPGAGNYTIALMAGKV